MNTLLKKVFIANIILTMILLAPSINAANIYTVCSSGCNYSTIQGAFNAQTMRGGDIVEVRADVPGGSKTYFEVVHPSGGGTSVNPVIFRARQGDYVTIDSQESEPSGNTLHVNNDYYIVDGFHVRGAQGPQIFVGYVGSGVTKNTGITIRNCSTYSASANGLANHEGIMVNRADSVQLLNNTLTTTTDYQGGNDTDCFYAAQFSDLTFDGNNCTISTGNGTLAPHNDGIQISGGNGINFPFGSATKLTIRNNSFFHNSNRTGFKQCIYVEYEVQDYVQIYNNVCKDTLDAGTNYLSVYNKNYGTQGTVSIYNNSIYVNGSLAAAIVVDEGCPNPSIKNNSVLWRGTNDYQTCIGVYSVTQTTSNINNNVCFKNGGTVLRNKSGMNFYTFADWQSNGYDVNSLNANPLYLNTATAPYDLSLQSSSPNINSGASLTTIFTIDKNGIFRPQGSAWDIGAYEFVAPTPPDSTPPIKPRGFRVK